MFILQETARDAVVLTRIVSPFEGVVYMAKKAKKKGKKKAGKKAK